MWHVCCRERVALALQFFIFMRYLLFLSLLIYALLFAWMMAPCLAISAPSGSTQINQTKEQNEETQNNASLFEPPEIILNDQKIIFNKKPVLDNEGWLFPLEEIANKLQSKVSVDIVNGIITIQRNQDKSTIELNIRNGVVIVNNRPFKTLFGFTRIILGQDAQMVPTSALVILLGLTVKNDEDGKLVLKSTAFGDSNIVGTVQPQKRQGIKDLLVDYFTVTNAFDWFKSQDFTQRRTEINNGFHNDSYSVATNLILKSGTGAPLVNFYGGNFSFYGNASPLQVHVGDRPLSLIKSPLLGGINMRGIQVQKEGWLKDSKLVFGTGLLPSNSKVLGKNLSFVKYGRLAEVAEFSTSPKKDWQFSFGQASYTDRITNTLAMTKQSGGLFAASITKTGKYIEGESNIAYGVTKDKLFGKSEQGPGADILVRIKPKDWLSIFSKGAYYSPGFFGLSSNPYFHDRNEGTFGVNVTLPKANLGLTHSTGKTNFGSTKPSDYEVTSVFGAFNPTKNSPTIIVSYSQNQAKISSTRAIDNLIFPINQSTISTVDLETLIERRTSSFFRASLLKNWKTVNLSSSINYFTFSNTSPLKTPLIGNESVTKLFTYDFNINKYINRYFGIQNYIQGSDLYKQVRFGFNLGPVLSNKLSLQFLTGALLQADENPKPTYTFNLNYQLSKKNIVSLNLDKTPFLTKISALYQYNQYPARQGMYTLLGEERTSGRIKGKVIVLDETPRKENEANKIILPSSSRERGIANIRIHLGNYTITTNELGVFEFPSLTPGVHRLRVEYSDLPSYLTSVTPEAVDVKVEGGKETNFNFVLAYFGSLSGKLTLSPNPEIKLEEEPELRDIRVYLDSSEFETLTNLDGTFNLGDIKPGKYKLKVDPDFLPGELEVDPQKVVEVIINPKEKIENVQLPVKYKTKEKEIREF